MSEGVIVDNLQRRLGGLTASPSRESIQSLAKWMIFHRKHSIALASWMARQYSTDDELEKQHKHYLYICMMHEIFIMYHPSNSTSTTTTNNSNNNDNNDKETMWERTSILRNELSQRVLVLAMKSIASKKKEDDDVEQLIDEKIKPMIHTWKKLNCLLPDNNNDNSNNDPSFYDNILHLLDDNINDDDDDDDDKSDAKEEMQEEENDNRENASSTALQQKEEAENDSQEIEEDLEVEEKEVVNDIDPKVADPTLSEELEDEKLEMMQEENDLTKDPDNNNNDNEDEEVQITDEQPLTPMSDVEMTSPDQSSDLTNDDSNDNTTSSSNKRKLEQVPTPVPSPPPPPPPQEVKFDFENSGISFRQVGVRELMAPAKAIETMQIARDLRNDAAVQLSSLLSTLPDHIYQSLKEKKSIDTAENENVFSDELLDIDIQESLENIRMYRDICIKLQKSRQKCVDMLIQSRCQFGSIDAAKQFYQMDERIANLKRKRSLLNDAMELEGIDFEDEDNDSHNTNDNNDDNNTNNDDVMDIIQTKQKISRSSFLGGTPSSQSGELEDLQWYLDSIQNKEDDNDSDAPST